MTLLKSKMYVTVDTHHAVCPGVFRNILKGSPRRAIKIRNHYKDGKTTEFTSPCQPDGEDLRVMLALIAIASEDPRRILRKNPATADGIELRKRFAPEHDAADMTMVVAQGTYKGLAEMMGKAWRRGDETITELRGSLERLANIWITISNGNYRYSFQLCSVALEKEPGTFKIAINPILSRSLIEPCAFRTVDVDAIRGLSASALIIYVRLCGWIDEGSSHKIALETLVGYGWGVPPQDQNAPETPPPKNTVRQWRVKARKALDEIRNLGWGVSGTEVVTIARQGRPR
jgi:hypothetical protein